MSVKMQCFVLVVAMGFVAGRARGDDPKTYQITISSVSKVGDSELAPGAYKLLVHTHDSKVRFTNLDTGKQDEFDGTVKIAGEKFATTAIQSDRSGSVNRIIEIRLGGSRTRVVFE